MANLSGFNANQVEPATSFEPIPQGKYTAVIANSEMKPTKANTGRYLELEFEVIEGDFNGRKLWARLNLENPNAVAVKIAHSELSSICRAVNIPEPGDSVQLHNLPMVIVVRQKASADGVIRNEIRGYERKESAPVSKPAQATNATPPWRRG